MLTPRHATTVRASRGAGGQRLWAPCPPPLGEGNGLWGVPPFDFYQEGLRRLGSGEGEPRGGCGAPGSSESLPGPREAASQNRRHGLRSGSSTAVSWDSPETVPTGTGDTNVRDHSSFMKEYHMYSSNNSKDCIHSKNLSFTSTMQSKL